MNWIAWLHELHLVTGTISLRGAKMSKDELSVSIVRLRKAADEMEAECARLS